MKYQVGDRVSIGVARRPGCIDVVGRLTDNRRERVAGRYTDTEGGVFFLCEDEHRAAPIDFHADGSKPVRDEQPKPPEPWVPKAGERVVMRGEALQSAMGLNWRTFKANNGATHSVPLSALQPDTASAPPQAESKLVAMLTEHGSAHGYTEDPVVTLERLLAGTKRDTLPAPPSCPHCADNAGMLDAACKRLGEREVEHAAALRELTRITAEFRAYRREHR